MMISGNTFAAAKTSSGSRPIFRSGVWVMTHSDGDKYVYDPLTLTSNGGIVGTLVTYNAVKCSHRVVGAIRGNKIAWNCEGTVCMGTVTSNGTRIEHGSFPGGSFSGKNMTCINLCDDSDDDVEDLSVATSSKVSNRSSAQSSKGPKPRPAGAQLAAVRRVHFGRASYFPSMSSSAEISASKEVESGSMDVDETQEILSDGNTAIDLAASSNAAGIQARMNSGNAASASNSSSPTSMNCPTGCGLTRFSTPRPRFICDVCRKRQPVSAVMHGCRKCDFDVCDACFNVVWEWEGDDGSWNRYSPNDIMTIETSVHSRSSSSVALASKNQRVLVLNMRQKDVISGHQRLIRRVPPMPPMPTDDMTIAFGGDNDDAKSLPLGPITSVNSLPSSDIQWQKAVANLGKYLLHASIEDSPPGWSPMTAIENAKLVKLSPGSPEYKEVERHFAKTMNKGRISQIERVQNKFLWQRFLQMKQQLIRKNSGDFNERMLFHGTGSTKPKVIYGGTTGSGFDPRLGDGYYGHGAYFAVNAQYSDSYAHSTRGGAKQMFLANVLTGRSKDYKTTVSDTTRTLRRPPAIGRSHNFYDSVKGGPHSGSIMYIIYDMSQAYPAYLITYK